MTRVVPIAACVALVAVASHAGVRADRDCAGVASLAVADTTITAADAVPSRTSGGDALPAYCRVRGVANERVGVGGVAFGIGFELRLPDGWNRRFFFQGGAGTDGIIFEPLGLVQGPGASGSDGSALSRGFAVVATDAGHQGFGQEFGLDPQARIDFGHVAVETVTRVAKEIIARYYRRPTKRSYLIGCSNGGRQGMIASQRYPKLFDGIVAADPVFDLSHMVMAYVWDTIALSAIAPTDGGGNPILAQAFSDGDLALLAAAVIDACDDADGLADDLVDAPSACRFDPALLACPGAKTATCLSQSQVAALARIFAGPRDSAGGSLYADWPWDGGLGSAGWRAWKLGTSQTPVTNAFDVVIGFSALRYLLFTPPDPGFDPLAFDFDADPARTLESASIVDAVSTDVAAFRKRRGKILFYTGMSDAAVSANAVIGYYQRLATAQGGLSKTRRFARLFLVPGMNHCGGGPALDRFDPLTAIVAWVEKGRAPRRLVATGSAFPGRSRPLCPYPEETRYRGTGSIEDAESFRCVAPSR
jgi:pimeloyl-ACP methyl ester carboxylesterase